MRRFLIWVLRGVAGICLLLVGAFGWLLLAPPDLLRVGTGYAAKIVCSNVFIAGRDADEVLADDVQAPGHPLLRLVSVDVDIDARIVRAQLVGLIAPQVAVFREGLGCAVVPDGPIAPALALSAPPSERAAADTGRPWPEGEAPASTDPRLAAILKDDGLLGPAYRAVVVVKDGRIVGEVYGEGFNAQTPLLGWSMTKTVNAALVGLLEADGRLDLNAKGLFPGWTDEKRSRIRLGDLLAMQSGLAFNEDYGDVTDVTRMLYLQPDMADYVASLPADAEPGQVFNYSSGESVLISRLWMSSFSDETEALAFPRRALFDPLGMQSAVLEADSRGTFVGGSYLYATARDWARFGLMLAQGGVWQGEQILSPAFVERINRATSASKGGYTEGQAWQRGAGNEPDEAFGLDASALWLLGHDGQSVAVLASENLVVVRLGLTPNRLGYRPQKLLAAISQALR